MEKFCFSVAFLLSVILLVNNYNIAEAGKPGKGAVGNKKDSCASNTPIQESTCADESGTCVCQDNDCCPFNVTDNCPLQSDAITCCPGTSTSLCVAEGGHCLRSNDHCCEGDNFLIYKCQGTPVDIKCCVERETNYSSCKLCQQWYEEELREDDPPGQLNKTWLIDVTNRFPCECHVNFTTDNPKKIVSPNATIWLKDDACDGTQSNGTHGECRYHPGAYACLRSKEHVNEAGQQCCYNNDGTLIPAGTAASGTPDKYQGSLGNPIRLAKHVRFDVNTYENCCEGVCATADDGVYCNYYIKKLRRNQDVAC